jgi:MoaA/NifB/PqqE/SkfB family radical SAM enzyme
MYNFDFSEFKKQGIERVGELNPYITLACDLRCGYCYMFNFLAKAKDESELMNPNYFLQMAEFFCKEGNGLDRMTLLGGEPTLHPNITDICNEIADLPIIERRMTTNGIGLHHLNLDKLRSGIFDHVSISIDGITPDINNLTRGKRTFDKIIETIGLYKQAGIPVSINYTVTTNNIAFLNDVIPFFAEKGVSIINFHRASLDGNAYQHQELLVNPYQWVQSRERLFEFLDENGANYPNLTVRVPYTFLTKEQVQTLGYKPIQEQNYHSPDGGHRLIVFPPTAKGKGLCYMSSDVIGQDKAELGHVTEGGLFVWNEDPLNELSAYRKSFSANVSTDLKHQDEGLIEADLIRVSHSFKRVIRTGTLSAEPSQASAYSALTHG